jgi:hypothetical protein
MEMDAEPRAHIQGVKTARETDLEQLYDVSPVS